jgi:2-keto-4-pentenoate hydratase/2-oxohepta-3-ene-1,7-dioic acid hydratase in catechol pathway
MLGSINECSVLRRSAPDAHEAVNALHRALMQNFNTDDMGHKIVKCITWLSTIHTLLPGDIVATGTNHRGLNPFMDGD